MFKGGLGLQKPDCLSNRENVWIEKKYYKLNGPLGLF